MQRGSGFLVLLGASACSLEVDSPDEMPYVQVFEFAQFSDGFQEYGRSLARIDTNGDGQDELVFGSPASDPDDDGAVLFVETTNLTVVNVLAPWRESAEGSLHHDEYGVTLTVADWNRDGALDIAVGDPGADVDETERAGEVWVYLAPIDLFERIRLRANVPVTGDRFGASLASGDFDGDGFADLAVGAPHPADVTADAGTPGIEVFFGPDFVRREKWDASGGGGRFGAALFAVPDDAGSAVLVAGAPEASSGSVQNGDAFAWERADGLGAPRRLAAAPPADAGFGQAGEIGDFNGDGQSELMVLAPLGRGGVYFFDPVSLADRGHVAMPGVFADRLGAPVVRFADVSRDRADELVLLSADGSEPSGILFSPGHGAAHMVLPFAAAAVIAGNADFDPESELLFTVPGRFREQGGFTSLRVVDFSWRKMNSQKLSTPRVSVIPGISELRDRLSRPPE